MDARDKAKELIGKFMPITYDYMALGNVGLALINAKRCAHIVVYELLNISWQNQASEVVYEDSYIAYWDFVKLEIDEFRFPVRPPSIPDEEDTFLNPYDYDGSQ